MYCPRCQKLDGKQVKMKPSKRTFHKKTKWICPKCNLIQMQEH